MYKKRSRGALLLTSVLLHGLLALLPWQEPQQERPRPVAVSKTPANTISVVDASQVPTLREPQSVQPSLPEPSVPPPKAVAPPEALSEDPIPETSDSPTDQPAPEAPSNTVPATPPPAAPSTPNSVTSAADEAQIEAEWAQLAGYFESKDEGFGFTLPEIFFNFGELGPANQFFDENNQPKFEVSSFYHFPEKTPEQVFEDVVMDELSHNTGFEPQRQENFPAGLAYQMLQGEMLRYLIIVRLRESEGSILILSKPLPGLEP